MSICQSCGRNMNNLNIPFCSGDCRQGVAVIGTMEGKTPDIEANIGLKRPYGDHAVIDGQPPFKMPPSAINCST